MKAKAEDKTTKYKNELLEAIRKNKIMRFDHAFTGFVSFGRRTAYEHALHEAHEIKEALFENRSKGVSYLLNKWINSDNATLQLAAMRLICETDDHHRLNQQYIDHTTKGNSITLTPEERNAEIERLKRKLINAD
jgi:hypothetical protein